MSQIEILLPKMGESVAEATIIKWLKNEGDRVEAYRTLQVNPKEARREKALRQRRERR